MESGCACCINWGSKINLKSWCLPSTPLLTHEQVGGSRFGFRRKKTVGIISLYRLIINNRGISCLFCRATYWMWGMFPQLYLIVSHHTDSFISFSCSSRFLDLQQTTEKKKLVGGRSVSTWFLEENSKTWRLSWRSRQIQLGLVTKTNPRFDRR